VSDAGGTLPRFALIIAGSLGFFTLKAHELPKPP
jgi:hypothetical protein